MRFPRVRKPIVSKILFGAARRETRDALRWNLRQFVFAELNSQRLLVTIQNVEDIKHVITCMRACNLHDGMYLLVYEYDTHTPHA